MTLQENKKINPKRQLNQVGLRPTRQRLALTELLFAHGDRHVTAELMQQEAEERGISVSLATIYNTLNQFTKAGLLREVAIEGAKTYFDTNTRDHHHFYFEDEDRIIDAPASSCQLKTMPVPPEGMEIARIDVTIRLRAK